MRTIRCEIEILFDRGEEGWIISIDAGDVAQTALLFSGLHLKSVPRIVFEDSRGNRTFVIQANTATLDTRTIPVTDRWIEALWRLLLDTHLNGWTNTAHIDQDFDTPDGSVSITFAIKQRCG